MVRPLSCLLVLLVLPGCLGTRTEKIHARRSPALIEQNQRALRPLTPSELEELFAEEREGRRVGPDDQRWNDHWRDTRADVDKVLASVPKDPWRAEELERRRVILGRAWSDVGHAKPPVPEPLPEPEGEYADPQDDPSNRPAPAEGEGEEGGGEEESSDEE